MRARRLLGYAPIQPAASSKSGFDGAVYKGTTVTVAFGVPGAEQYRVFTDQLLRARSPRGGGQGFWR
jgi:hypothetical protein